jgi:hypothetical protein
VPQAHTDKSRSSVLSQHLLLALAEQIKLPLLQIARQAELASIQDCASESLANIQAASDAALKLVDSYVLGVQLALEDPYLLEMEPVSVSSVLYDAGHQLDKIAKAYDVTVELRLSGRYGPVMAHRLGLQASLMSLGYSLIEALPALEKPQLKLELGAHRCRYGIVAGLYCEAEQITTQALRQGRALVGQARQPLSTVSHTSAAGVFVADAILQAMKSQLKVSRHRNLYGLGAILQPNPQMQLV